jgi:hypothetical protein
MLCRRLNLVRLEALSNSIESAANPKAKKAAVDVELQGLKKEDEEQQLKEQARLEEEKKSEY